MLLTKKRLFLLCSLFVSFLLACSQNPIDGSLNIYYGEYEVISAERYRGGLTTESDANRMIGSFVTLCPSKMISNGTQIDNPVYKKSVSKIIKQEGVVPNNKDSVFYGVMPERDEIEYIIIYKNDNFDSQLERFEVIGKNALMTTYDGFFFTLIKRSLCN